MQKLNTFLQNFKKTLRQNLFPERFACHICGVEIFEGDLCADCLKTVVFNDGASCPVCGRRTNKSEVCLECKAHMPAYKKAVSALSYDGGGGELVVRFKNGSPYLSRYLAELIAGKLKDLPGFDGIVFVPMTAKDERSRGYNQSRLLAEELSVLCGAPVISGAVEKIKDTPGQKELPRAERLRNLNGCFKVDKSAVKGKTVLIVDDVMTTGATLDSLAAALKKAGAKEVFAACTASVEYAVI